MRQLRNVIDSAVVLADGDEIQPHDLGLRDSGGDQLDSLEIDVWEKKLIIEALRRSRRQRARGRQAAGHRPGDAVP